ncbi:uncharacterized protein LOC132798264 isoform X1 [Drosophila nasuta]|uniref:uncharacterized protein LOC132798264 isoform X1 n=2 Tax=Drosophila nasuta TaxID=42062 RepID=UPI00295EA916|nr:uncharacterized protein LOC132798264 isoform X1 [Drosophila nasuta]
MKKVLLTKSQQIRVSNPEIKMKPLIGVGVTAATTTSPPPVSVPVRVMHVQTNVITNTYMQRKSFQSIYEDIFKLLMRLPDKALQQRVIDAINGRSDKSSSSTISSNQCKQCAAKEEKPLKINASTQTEFLETKETKIESSFTEVAIKSDLPLKQECPTTKTETPTKEESTESGKPSDPAVKVPRKRGRKRNTCVPQVVKRSAAQMAMQERENKQLTPLQTNKKKKLTAVDATTSGSYNTNANNVNVNNSSSCIQRRDSMSSNFSLSLSDISLTECSKQIDTYIENGVQDTILATMSKEFRISHVMNDEGLLPIHDAILENNIYGVQRQVFVWSKMKQNVALNELLSQAGEDCLQLAITNDSDPEIVKIIINAGVLPMYIYEDSNTALHLAIINNIQLDSLQMLMLHIDLNLLLLTNDDGYTALHIAIRHNRYKMAEVICDTIDQRQLGASVYRRPIEGTLDEAKAEGSSNSSNKSLEVKDEQRFAKFYERACDKLEHNKDKLLGRRLKNEILNASETRAGNACLFYAVEGELEHLCYFLLAHLSDPDEENLSGHSPKSFHYEFARVLRISLKIARIMDKVIGILNGKSS